VLVLWCDVIVMPHPCGMPAIACDVIIDGRAATAAMASTTASAQRREAMIDRVTEDD
jgi:hypothetical protein